MAVVIVRRYRKIWQKATGHVVVDFPMAAFNPFESLEHKEVWQLKGLGGLLRVDFGL